MPQSQWIDSNGEIIKYPSHELTADEILNNYLDFTNFITNEMINTNADIEFSKMLYPTIPLNYFLVDTGIFIQVNFNMLAGTIDLTQIPNTYITYAKLNIADSDIPYVKINIASNEIIADKILSLPFTKVTGTIDLTQISNTYITYAKLNISDGDIPYAKINIASNEIIGDKILSLPFTKVTGTIDLTQIPNTYITYAKLNISDGDIPYIKINIASNEIIADKILSLPFTKVTGTIDLTQIPNTYITYAKLNIGAGDIAYWKLTLTSWITNNDLSGSINFNKMLYPAYNGYFLRDDGTFQPVSGGTIPDDSIDLIKLKTVVGNAYNLYGYSSVGVPIATK